MDSSTSFIIHSKCNPFGKGCPEIVALNFGKTQNDSLKPTQGIALQLWTKIAIICQKYVCLEFERNAEFISLSWISYVGNMEIVSKEILYEIFSWLISFLVAIQTLNKLVSTLKVPGNIRTFLGMNWMNMNFPQHTLSRNHKGRLPQLLKTKNSPTCDSDSFPLETNWQIPSDAYAKRLSNCDKIERDTKT